MRTSCANPAPRSQGPDSRKLVRFRLICKPELTKRNARHTIRAPSRWSVQWQFAIVTQVAQQLGLVPLLAAKGGMSQADMQLRQEFSRRQVSLEAMALGPLRVKNE